SLVLHGRTGDVHKGTKVEFRPTQPPKPKRTSMDWPFYHRDLTHSGYLAAPLRPPFRRRWQFTGKILMEFPPVLAKGTLFFARNNGSTYALNADTGHVRWKKRIGLLSAGSPAYRNRPVLVTSLP